MTEQVRNIRTERSKPAGNSAPPGRMESGGRVAAVTRQKMTDCSVLLIASDDSFAQKMEAIIGEKPGAECVRVDALFDGLRQLQERAFGVVVSELFLPDGQGLATLRHLQQHAAQTPVIALCHTKDRETGVSAVRRGAHDFFCHEDLDPAGFLRSLESAYHAEVGDTKNGVERRTSARFPCRLAVTYQTLEHPMISGQGTSETLNISSKGLLFATDAHLESGQLLQVSLDWPARLENQVPLKLVAEGRIVRNSGGQAAMTIDKYEFRTRRPAPRPAGS